MEHIAKRLIVIICVHLYENGMYIQGIIKSCLKTSKNFREFLVYNIHSFQPNSMPISGYVPIDTRDKILQSDPKNIKYFKNYEHFY